MKSEQEKRIRRIVRSAQSRDEYTIFETWHAYLEKHLTGTLLTWEREK